MTSEFFPLTSLEEGQQATVFTITAAEATAKRLADMGFSRGERIEMLRPGRPCLVRIGRTCIGLGQEIQQVIVLHSAHRDGDAFEPDETI